VDKVISPALILCRIGQVIDKAAGEYRRLKPTNSDAKKILPRQCLNPPNNNPQRFYRFKGEVLSRLSVNDRLLFLPVVSSRYSLY
jgi:hypothetical protein